MTTLIFYCSRTATEKKKLNCKKGFAELPPSLPTRQQLLNNCSNFQNYNAYTAMAMVVPAPHTMYTTYYLCEDCFKRAGRTHSNATLRRKTWIPF